MQVVFMFFLMTIMVMPRKPQIAVNLPRDACDWVQFRIRQLQTSNTRFGLAGYIRLVSSGEPEQKDSLFLASLIDSGFLEWADIEAYGRCSKRERSRMLRVLKSGATREEMLLGTPDEQAQAAVRRKKAAVEEVVRAASAKTKTRQRRIKS